MTPDLWARAPLAELVLHLGRGTSPVYAVEATGRFAVNQKCVRHGRVSVEHVRPHAPHAPVKPDSVLRPGDICVNSTGTGTIGRVGVWHVPEDGTYFADTHVTVVRPDPRRVDSRYLSESLLAPKIQREMEVSCFTGSTNQIELSKSAFAALMLDVPPLGEQRKIAAILSSVHDAIEATQAVIDQLQVVKKAMMADLLTRGLPGRHSKFRMTEIGEVPEAWKVGSLGPNTRITTGKLDSNRSVVGGRYPFFTCSQETLQIDEYSFDCEALLLAGNNAKGVYSIKHFSGKFDAYQRTYVITIPDVRELSYGFLKYWLEFGLEQLTRLSTGTSTKFLTLQVLKPLPVLLPSIEEQQVIASMLSAVEVRGTTEGVYLGQLQTLSRSLQEVILTGEVRVTPDEEAT
jgi:type I restriction enzyme, S subunit